MITKKKEKYSYSRVSTFGDCPLKYKYRYADKIRVSGIHNELANKGTVFHDMCENYKMGETKEQCMEALAKKAEELGVKVEDYNYEEGVDRWLHLQNNVIKPLLESGYTEHREQWINGIVAGQPFTGAIDDILISKDKLMIIDYKTAKTIKTAGYRKQLMLYAWYKGKEHFGSTEDLADKVELWVFFPLGESKAKTIEERTEKSFVQILFSQEELEENFKKFDDDVNSILNIDFSSIETHHAKTSYGCQWCDYRGSIKNSCFDGCPKSYEEGLRQSRSTKFYKD